jgi:hypothetical protein
MALGAGDIELDVEAARLSKQYALGDCTSSWLESSYLLRVVSGWIIVALAVISLVTSLVPSEHEAGLWPLCLIALPAGGLLIAVRPRSRLVRLYLFEGGAARVANAGPGPRLVVLPWADLTTVRPWFDGDGDLTSCVLRGRSGVKLVLGRHDGAVAPQAITDAAQRVLASQPPA